LVITRYPSGLDSAPSEFLFALALFLVLPLWLAWGDRHVRWSCFFIICALAGCGRAMLVHPPVTPNDISFYNGKDNSPPLLVTGTISGEPALTDQFQRVRVTAEAVRLPGENEARSTHGDLLAILPRFPAFDVGEKVSLSGVLTAPPRFSTFDYPAYLARQGVYSYMRYPRARSLGMSEAGGNSSWFTQLVAISRQAVRGALQRSLAEPEAALAVGVVIGDRSSMPKKVQDDFQVSGTVHILAISGENLSLIIGFIWLIFGVKDGTRRMPAWLTILVIILLAAYTLFTGTTPSVIRAAIMGTILLLAPLVGRRYDPVAAIAVSAGVMAFADPYVLADGGFQLSFGALLGITLLSPGIYRLMKRLRVPSYLALALATSFGAQAATFPLIILLTGRLSLVSPLATLTTDFSLLPLMVVGIVTGIVGIFVPPLAAITGLLAWLCGAWMIWGVGWWASLPWASLTLGTVNPLWLLVYYGAISYALAVMHYGSRQPSVNS
jgi:competence protein ComEC